MTKYSVSSLIGAKVPEFDSAIKGGSNENIRVSRVSVNAIDVTLVASQSQLQLVLLHIHYINMHII